MGETDVIAGRAYFQFFAENAMGRTFYGYREDFFSCLGLEDPLFSVERLGDASMIGSLCADGMHAPVLGIDFPAQLAELPGGRRELIFGIETNNGKFQELVSVMRRLGICGYGSGSRLILGCPAVLLPSETSGHFHLYLEIKIFWQDYAVLLVALFESGVIERGFYDTCLRNLKSTATLPWVKRKEVLPQGY